MGKSRLRLIKRLRRSRSGDIKNMNSALIARNAQIARSSIKSNTINLGSIDSSSEFIDETGRARIVNADQGSLFGCGGEEVASVGHCKGGEWGGVGGDDGDGWGCNGWSF